MGYDDSDGVFDKIPTKKLILVFGLVMFGAFFMIQSMLGFPIKDLFRQTVTQELPVILKQDGICVIDTPDNPRSIPDCPYNVGDILIVTYKKGTAPIEKYELKSAAANDTNINGSNS